MPERLISATNPPNGHGWMRIDEDVFARRFDRLSVLYTRVIDEDLFAHRFDRLYVLPGCTRGCITNRPSFDSAPISRGFARVFLLLKLASPPPGFVHNSACFGTYLVYPRVRQKDCQKDDPHRSSSITAAIGSAASRFCP